MCIDIQNVYFTIDPFALISQLRHSQVDTLKQLGFTHLCLHVFCNNNILLLNKLLH